MTFPILFQATLRLLVLDALGALWLTEIVGLPTLLAVGVLCVGSWWAEDLRTASPGYRRVWDILTVGFLAYTALDLMFLAESLIAAVTHLLLFLVVYKLYNTRSHRDVLDLFILTFLQLVAASTLTASFGFFVVFCVYMILGIWGLILFHLKRETELNFPERSRDLLGAPGLVMPSFLASSVGVAVIALVLTLAIFFLIPRVGRTFFSLRGPIGEQTVGFSDRVELGTYGTIQTDPTIVMRVSFPEDPGAVGRFPGLRWRGVAFDRFDGRVWSLADPLRAPARPVREGVYGISPFLVGTPFLTAEVFLEPIGTDVLFAAPRLRMIQGRLPRPSVDGGGGVTLPSPPITRVRYQAVSQPERVREDILRRPVRPADYPPDIRDTYLQLPVLSPRVRELAGTLAEGARTPIEVIRRVEAYLNENLRYSLDLGQDADIDPLEDFLFVRKTGNCEYFATSLVVLLRIEGIPARVVNGFQRGEWNEVGQFLAVRQRDAHSWAEVYFPGSGWVTFDPSPRAAFEAQAFGDSGVFGKYFDVLRWRWNRYVVDYNLGDQAAFAIGLRQRSQTFRRSLGEAWSAWSFQAYRNIRRLWRRSAYPLAVAAVLILAGVIFWRRLSVSGVGADWLLRARLRRSPVAFYERMLRVLARRGSPRPSTATAREYASSLAGRPQLHDPVAELTSLYERVRFGGEPLAPSDHVRAASLLRQLAAAGR
jgi:transglutaminase-like putative cysteine protease